MENLLGIIYILMTIFLITLSIERLMGVFFEKRRTSRPITFGSYLLFFIFSVLGASLGSALFETLSIFSYFIIALNYKSSMIKRFVVVVCSYLCIQMIRGMFMVVVGVIPFVVGAEYSDFNIVALLFLASALLTYVITSLFRKFRYIKTSTMILPTSWISLLVIPGCSIAIVTTLINFVAYLPQLTMAIISIMAFAITIFSFYFQNAISKAYEDKLKSALHTKEKEYYFAQCQLMQESVDKIKSIHHDMKFHLATARDFTANNKANEASVYLNGLLGDIGKIESYSDTGNIAFDSIINFKLKNAVNDNIKLDINVSIPPVLNIEAADVVTILGNLLDNAIDATTKIDDKRIKLIIESNKGNIFITAENTFDGVVKYANQTFEDKRQIITRKDGSRHGYGLKNIRKSVEKYNGHIDISHDGNVFSVGALLYLDDA